MGLAFGVLAGIGAYTAKEAIADRFAHKRIRRYLLEKMIEDKPFDSEELIREADKLMHDDKESDDARDFARRVYIIGRTAQAAQEEEEDE